MPMTRGNKYKCYYCGQEEVCTSDHFIPRSKGGRLKVWACALCQNSKRNLDHLVWLEYVQNHIAITQEAKDRIKIAVRTLHNKIVSRQLDY